MWIEAYDNIKLRGRVERLERSVLSLKEDGRRKDERIAAQQRDLNRLGAELNNAWRRMEIAETERDRAAEFIGRMARQVGTLSKRAGQIATLLEAGS